MARDAFLAKHQEVDPEQLPLTALFLADLIRDGKSPSDRTDLLRLMLEREREKFWRDRVRVGHEEAVMALSTMIDGYSSAHFQTLPLPMQALLRDCASSNTHWAALKHILPAKPGSSQGSLGRLLPDLLGEFHVLEMLELKNEATGEQQFPFLAEAAWRAAPEAMLEFAARALRDFMGHGGVPGVLQSVDGVYQSYVPAAQIRAAIGSHEQQDENLLFEAPLEWLLSTDDPAAHFAAGRHLFALTVNDILPRFDLQRMAAAVMAIGQAADETEADPALMETWAKSVTNFIGHTAAADAKTAKALLAQLDGRASAAGADPALMVEWAKSVTNFISDTAAADAKTAKALLAQLDGRASAAGADPALMVEWAKSVTNFINRTAAADAGTAKALLAQLDGRASAAGADPALMVAWANSVTNFINRTAAADAGTAKALLAQLDGRASAAEADPALMVAWAESVTNFIGHTAAADAEAAKALLAQLDGRASAAGADPALMVAWAESVTNFIGRTAAADAKTAKALLEQLDGRASAAEADPALMVAWAKSVAAMVAGLLQSGKNMEAHTQYEAAAKQWRKM